jgi:hypothetical protein
MKVVMIVAGLGFLALAKRGRGAERSEAERGKPSQRSLAFAAIDRANTNRKSAAVMFSAKWPSRAARIVSQTLAGSRKKSALQNRITE